MKMNQLAGAAMAFALSLGAHAQQLQIADSTGGRQTAGIGIDQSAIYNGINDARGRAMNAQGMAEWAGQAAQNASQVASAAQGTASYAVGRAADARARADYTAWYNWNYTRATAISNCMATGGNPIYCTVAADSMYPAP
jgi:hypothetical protein